MDPRPLTDTEAEHLTRSGLGVRLTTDALVTRTCLYEWSPESRLWYCLEHGLRLAHVKTDDGRGFRWEPTQHRFLPCRCDQCLNTDTDDEP